MKIFLLHPPETTGADFPPLWPARLAGVIREAGYAAEIHFIDCRLLDADRLSRTIARIHADVIVLMSGVGVERILDTLPLHDLTGRIVFLSDSPASEVKRDLPKSVTVTGDIVGQFSEVLEAIRAGTARSAYRRPIQSIDAWPVPDLRIFDFSISDFGLYRGLTETRRTAVAVSTVHGDHAFSPARFSDELMALHRQGAGVFVFLDEDFAADPHRALEICKSLEGLNLHLQWKCSAEPANLTPALLEHMRAAGCYAIQLNRPDPQVSEFVRTARIIAAGEGHDAALALKHRIDKLARLGVRRLVIHGTGVHGQTALQLSQESGLQVLAFSDNRPTAGVAGNLRVILPDKIAELMPDAVLIASKGSQGDIYRQLEHMRGRGIQVIKSFDSEYLDLDRPLPIFDQFRYINSESFTPSDNGTLLMACLPRNFSEMSLLDCGCGLYRGGNILLRDLPFRQVNGIDIYEPYIAALRQQEFPLWRKSEFEQLDSARVLERFGPKSIDLVVSFDVLEHMPKPAGQKLLEDLETIARSRVILWVPEGEWEQEIDEHGHDAWGYPNPYQTHQSAWESSDLTSRGYTVFRVEGEENHNDRSRAFSKLWAYKDV